MLFRFLVGFGLGGELPVAATLMTEYAPTKLRGRFIVLLESFWGLGWLAAACIAYLLIPQYGWQVAFFIGALPALYVFMIRLHMPESVRYLISRGKIGEAQKIVLMLEEKLNVQSEPFAEELSEVEKGTEHAAAPKLSTLWSGTFARRTAMLWMAWFGINFSYYGIFMWLPSIVFQQGFTVVKTFEYVLIMTLAQLPGYYCAAWLVDVIGRKYTLSMFLLISGVLYTYTPELYPTAIRALGSGYAAGFGRIGSMIAPAMVGMLIGGQMGSASIFMLFAGVFVVVSAVVMGLGVESRKKSLEEIAEEAVESGRETARC